MRITGFKARKDYTQNLIKSTYSTERDYLSKNKHVIWLYQNYSLWSKGNMRNHNFMLHSNEISPHTLGKIPTGKYFSIYFDHRQWLFSMMYPNTFLSSGIWHFLLEELKILAQLSSQDKSSFFFFSMLCNSAKVSTSNLVVQDGHRGYTNNTSFKLTDLQSIIKSSIFSPKYFSGLLYLPLFILTQFRFPSFARYRKKQTNHKYITWWIFTSCWTPKTLGVDKLNFNSITEVTSSTSSLLSPPKS